MGTSVATFRQSRRAASRNTPRVNEVYAESMKALVASHRKIKGQVLHLAIWYKTDERRNLHLFEIVEGFPPGNGDPTLFTVESPGSEKFPIARPGKLYLTLINPAEAITAFEHAWHGTQDIRSSLQQGDVTVLFKDKLGKQLFDMLIKV